jgi:hypothetical protein
VCTRAADVRARVYGDGDGDGDGDGVGDDTSSLLNRSSPPRVRRSEANLDPNLSSAYTPCQSSAARSLDPRVYE